MTLKLYKDAMVKPYTWAGGYKNRIDQPGQIKWSKLPLKYLELILATLFSITLNQTK